MNKIIALSKKVFLLLILVSIGSLKAQLMNGNFNNPGDRDLNFGNPPILANWTSDDIEYIKENDWRTPLEDSWLDLTGTPGDPVRSGDGKFISQKIYTSACIDYKISFDLSTWNDSIFGVWDAGVILYIDGIQIGGRIVANSFSPNPSVSNLSWERHSVIFRGTGKLTEIKFISSSIRISGIPNKVSVIAFDSVTLDSLSQPVKFNLTSQKTDCNTYCLNINKLTPNVNGPISNIKWLIDNVAIQNGGMKLCRRFPKSSIPKNAKVEFDFINANGCKQHFIYSLPIISNEICDCDYDKHVKLKTTYLPCNSYDFKLEIDPGYEAGCTYWTVDGVKESEVLAHSYAPGEHEVCVFSLGYVIGEPENSCCIKKCFPFTIPNIINETINREYCELISNGYWFNPCNELSGFSTFSIYRKDGYQDLNKPCPSGAYSLGEGTHLLELFDANGCLIKRVTIIVNKKVQTESKCLAILDVPCGEEVDTTVLNSLTPNCNDCISDVAEISPWTISSETNDLGIVVLKYSRKYINRNCHICTFEVFIHRVFNPSETYSTDLIQFGDCGNVAIIEMFNCLGNKARILMTRPDGSTAWVSGNYQYICCMAPFDSLGYCTYIFDGFDANGCGCRCILKLKCDGSVSNSEQFIPEQESIISFASKYKIIPNPTASIFQILSPIANEIYELVEIKDVNGKVLISKANADAKTYFDMSDYSSGTYLVVIKTAAGIKTLKLLTSKD